MVKSSYFKKGLGTRNFVLMLLLFSYYYSSKDAFNLICVEEPESHLSVNNFNLVTDFIQKNIDDENTLTQVILTSHNPKIINKLKLSNVVAISGEKTINFNNVEPESVDYLAKRPNFDIIKLLFSNRVILVEGPCEEMFINTQINLMKVQLSEIEIITIGHKGFKKFLDIWLVLNSGNSNKKIGIVRDFDNQPNAKQQHDEYDEKHGNIFVRTTVGYTFEDDLVSAGQNELAIKSFFNFEGDIAEELNMDSESSFLRS